MKRQSGGQSKFNPVLAEKLLAMLEEYDRVTACQAVGIGRRTFYYWYNEGKDDVANGRDTEKAEFYVAANKARYVFKGDVIRAMRREGIKGNVQAGKAILQAEDRRTWGDSIQVTEELKVMFDRLKENLDPEIYRKVIDALED